MDVRYTSTSGVGTGIYEAVYQAKGSPVAGLGLAALRDFASYLKHGPGLAATLREMPASLQRVIGYGYSQSGRFPSRVRSRRVQCRRARPCRVRWTDDFFRRRGRRQLQSPLRDARSGRQLGALRAASGGSAAVHGRGTAGQGRETRGSRRRSSTRSRPPSTGRARDRSRTRPRRARADAPLAATSRLYFLAGTPHSSGGLPLTKGRDQYRHFVNFAQQRWVTRALLLDLDAWTRGDETASVAVSDDVERGAGAARGRALPQGAIVSIRDLHAACLADGLRPGVRGDARDLDRAAANRRAVSACSCRR